MGSLSKRQRKVLGELNKVFPNSLSREELLSRTSFDSEMILPDITVMEDKGYLSCDYGLNEVFPRQLKIEAKGIDKLSKTLIVKFIEHVGDNQLLAITVVLTIISLIGGGFFYLQSNYYQSQALELEKQASELSKPHLSVPDTRVEGGRINELRFSILNPTSDVDYYFMSGTCKPEINGLFSVPTPETPKSKSLGVNIAIPKQVETSGIKIPPHEEITLFCRNKYVANPQKDTVTFIEVCVKIDGLSEPICKNMNITILKT